MLAKGQMMPEKRRFPVVIDTTQLTSPANRQAPTPGLSHTRAAGADAPLLFDARNGMVNEGISQTLQAKESGSYSLNATPILVAASAMVRPRRLMPVECERLQGFPDGWTAGHADTPRYRMLGNAVTVNVAAWIGRRIVAASVGASL